MSKIPTKKELARALEARHGTSLQKTFANSRIAVCGLGGLGSNIAISLARAGIGTLILIDYDRVDITNLHRQQYKATQIGMPKTKALAENLAEIAPYLNIAAHTARLTLSNYKSLLSGADVICEAFDNAEEKAMLANAVLANLPETYLIAASGMAGIGPANSIKTQKISSHFYLCGDGASEVTDGVSLLSSRVMLCAAHQAHTALRILAKEFDV
ncbi:MAG: thiamine biosynthesis protein ThiF [Eubacterium sp.]|jgi:sulfur carrier protein ThiS adenylyltransferase|nr:thiamine biosynthesis protein ThiF [Eubacterium sp.]